MQAENLKGTTKMEVKMYFLHVHVLDYFTCNILLNKNSLAVKIVRGQSEAMHNGYKRPKTLISSKAKKLNVLLERYTIVYRAFSQL